MRSSLLRTATLLVTLLFSAAARPAGLQGSEWQPRAGGSDGQAPFIQFRGNGRFVVHGACNRMTGVYGEDADRLSIALFTATPQPCADRLRRDEAALADALLQTRRYRRERTRLMLFDAAGTVVLELRQTDWD